MSILNIMWAGGSAYASVQKVHQQILSHVVDRASVDTWLLQGSAEAGEAALEETLFGPAQRPAPVEIAAAEVARAFPKGAA
jgi:hypothetical protein